MLTELLTIIDRSAQGTLRIAGLVARDVAHSRGVPHGSALVAVVVGRTAQNRTEPCLVLQKRPACKDVCPGLWDVFGGHLAGGGAMLDERTSWEDGRYIERLYDETALREVNEECLVGAGRGRNQWQFRRQHLMRFGDIGEFEHGLKDPHRLNREYSTLYGAFVPPNVLSLGPEASATSISACERVPASHEYRVAFAESICLSWPELLDRYSGAPEAFADGIGRALSRAAREPQLMQALELFLEQGLNLAGTMTVDSQ